MLSAGLLTSAVVSLALFGPLYWLSLGNGTWFSVLQIHLLLLTLAAFLLARYLRSCVRVVNGRLVKRVFPYRPLSIPIGEIDRVILVDVQGERSTDAVTHFVALDESGRRLMRLRGTFWQEHDMHLIAAELGVLVRVIDSPLTPREFRTAFPRGHWHERDSALRLAVGTVAAAVAVVVAAALVTQ